MAVKSLHSSGATVVLLSLCHDKLTDFVVVLAFTDHKCNTVLLLPCES